MKIPDKNNLKKFSSSELAGRQNYDKLLGGSIISGLITGFVIFFITILLLYKFHSEYVIEKNNFYLYRIPYFITMFVGLIIMLAGKELNSALKANGDIKKTSLRRLAYVLFFLLFLGFGWVIASTLFQFSEIS